MIQTKYVEKIAVLQMAHGKVNALDIKMCEALRRQLETEKVGDSLAVVLTGSGSIFSAGVDLFRLLKEDKSHTLQFLDAFANLLETLFHFPKPIIAAINGHAIAGGCVLACACDERIMAAGPGKIGVPELLVGVPFPSLAIRILQNAIPQQQLTRLIYSGETVSAEEALARQIVGEVATAEALPARAQQLAQSYGALSPQAFSRTKQSLRAGTTNDSLLDREVVEVWTSEQTRQHIRAYLETTLKKK